MELMALKTMAPNIESPFESQGKALQLRQMLAADQQNQFQQQQQRQAQQDDAGYRDALRANPDGGAGLLRDLAGRGMYKQHAAAVKADQDQRKGNADIDKDKATTQKTLFDVKKEANQMVGAAAGALSKAPTYENAVTIVNQLKQTLGPEMANILGLDALEIPRDPRQIAQWANQHYLAAIDADKQMENDRVVSEGLANRTAADVNSRRSAASSKYSADSSAGTARARLAYDKERDSTKGAGAEPSMSPETIARLAKQVLRGDRTGLANMGRGAQGAANLVAVQNAVTEEATRAGMSPEQITAASASLEGLRTGMRATGNISARVENAAQEAAELAPLALEASRGVARSGFLPFGKAQIMFNTQTNDPALAKFATANLGLATAYASAMARGNKPTVSDNIALPPCGNVNARNVGSSVANNISAACTSARVSRLNSVDLPALV